LVRNCRRTQLKLTKSLYFIDTKFVPKIIHTLLDLIIHRDRFTPLAVGFSGHFADVLKRQYALPLGQYLNLDSHSELSARLGYEFDNGVNIALWGKNLTDEEYWARGIQVVAANTPAQRGAPRTYGIAVGYDF